MDADKKNSGADAYDEEVRDVLIAISVVAKRLATKMEKQTSEGSNVCKVTEQNTMD